MVEPRSLPVPDLPASEEPRWEPKRVSEPWASSCRPPRGRWEATSTVARSGNLLFLSGHGPLKDGRVSPPGPRRPDLTIEQGREAARLTGLNLLATARDALGSLDRVRRVVKVLGMVQCTDDFTEHPKVINGFSDLMVEVFGDAGRHARAAVGMGSLPFGIAVEIEMVLEVAGGAPRSRPVEAYPARSTSGRGSAAPPVGATTATFRRSGAVRDTTRWPGSHRPRPPTSTCRVRSGAQLFVAGHDPERDGGSSTGSGGRVRASRGHRRGPPTRHRERAGLSARRRRLARASPLRRRHRVRLDGDIGGRSIPLPVGEPHLLAAALPAGGRPAVWLRPAQGLAAGMPVEIELMLETVRRQGAPARAVRRPGTEARAGARGPRRSGARTS